MKYTAPKAQYAVARIEARRLAPDEAEKGTGWTIAPFRGPDGVLLLSGHLWSIDDGLSQAQVLATVVYADTPLEDMSVEERVQHLDDSFVIESLYDLARRSLMAQAALCDIALDLPLKAPDYKLDLEADADDDDQINAEPAVSTAQTQH